jgi:neutral ceramidase
LRTNRHSRTRNGTAEHPLLAGAARVDITPPRGTPLAGTCTLVRARKVIDRIFARALVLEQAGVRVAIVTADVVAFREEMTARLRRALAGRCRIDMLLCNASHTHTGPDTYNEFCTFSDPRELAKRRRYHHWFERQLLALVERAATKLEPVTLSHGEGRATFGVQRRRRVDGAIRHMPNPTGFHDKTVSVFRFGRADGKPLAVLFSHACHPSTRYAEAVSADFPGPAQRLVERETGAIALFAQGAAGEIRPRVVQPHTNPPRFCNGTQQDVERFGRELGAEVMRVLRGRMAPLRPDLGVRESLAVLPFDRPYSAKLMRTYLPYEASATTHRVLVEKIIRRFARAPLPRGLRMPLVLLRLADDHAILATGHELTNAYVPRLQRLAPGLRLTVLGYTNAYGAYIGTSQMIEEGGYEGDWSCFYFGLPMPLHPSADALLTRACARLLCGMAAAQKPRFSARKKQLQASRGL